MAITIGGKNANHFKYMAKFKDEILEKIKTDPDLYFLVVKEMKCQPASLANALRRNSRSLNQYEVYEAVARYLKSGIKELLEAENSREMEKTKVES